MAIKFNRATLHADIEKIRNTIAALKEEAAWIETSRPPKADLIDKLTTWVNQLALGSDSIKRLLNDDDPRNLFKAETNVGYGGYGRSAELGPLLCELFADHIKNTLGKKIEQLDYEPGPPLAERPQLLEQNAMQIKQLEIAEESMIIEAEKVGVPIPRRADLSPEIFLEVDQFPPLPEVPESLGTIEYRERQAALTEMYERNEKVTAARLVGRRGQTNFDIV